MPKLTNCLPKYQKHLASGQARVTICGRDYYLGPYGAAASHHEYDRLIAEYLANGRRPPGLSPDTGVTVAELIAAFWKHAQVHYRKDGRATSQIDIYKLILRHLRQLYGSTQTSGFGPAQLKAIRQFWIRRGYVRTSINAHVRRLVHVFKWGVAEGLVQPAVYEALRTLPSLLKGRSKARESKPVKPVADETVEQTLEHLGGTAADMVRIQRLTGCRPGEVCQLRPCDIDRSGDVWIYCPQSHKTAHHGRTRTIPIGPKAQAILRPYLLRDDQAYCFSPAESEQQRLGERSLARTTPPSCGNSPGTNRKRRRKRAPADRYTSDSYRRAIHRACAKAGIDHWSPNQLRHTAGTEMRRKFGVEAAQTVLGQANLSVTEIYAERDLAQAAQVAREVG